MFGLRVHLHLFIYLFYLIFCADSENPVLIHCANPECSEPISEAHGVLVYHPIDKNVLGFNKGVKIQILGKSKEKGYWVGKIGNNIGFVPSSHLKEVTVWKSSDMLKYEVPLSIENHKIYIKNRGNSDLGQDNVGTNPQPEINAKVETILKGSTGSPLSNLIHGDISGEYLRQQMRNEHKASSHEVPDPNVEPTGTNADNMHTVLPADMVNETIDYKVPIDGKVTNENLNYAGASSFDKSLEHDNYDNATGENSDDSTAPSKNLAPDDLNPGKSDEFINLNNDLGNEVNNMKQQMVQTQAGGVEPEANKKLNNGQNVNEKLEENIKGNVVGSIKITNSNEDSEGTNASSDVLFENDTDNVSISSSSSSSDSSSSGSSSSSNSNSNSSNSSVETNIENSQKSSSIDTSINEQKLNVMSKDNLSGTTLDYSAASENHESIVVPVENKEKESISKNENDKENLYITSSGNALNEENIPQTNIQSFVENTFYNGNGNGDNLKKAAGPAKKAVGTAIAASSRSSNMYVKSDIIDIANTGGINSDINSTSSSGNNISSASSSIVRISRSISSSDSSIISSSSSSDTSIISSSISVSSTSSTCCSSILNSGNDLIDEATKVNSLSSDVTAEQLAKESIKSNQDPGFLLKGSHVPDAMDVLNACSTQLYQTPMLETLKDVSDLSSVNKKGIAGQGAKDNEGKTLIFNPGTPSVVQSEELKNNDISPPVTRISSQEITTEKLEFDISTEEITKNFNTELPGHKQTAFVDSVSQNTDENTTGVVVTEPSIPAPDHVVQNPTEKSPTGNDISEGNPGESGLFSKMSNYILAWIGLGDDKSEEGKEIKQDENFNNELIKDILKEKTTEKPSVTLEENCESVDGLHSNCKQQNPEETKTGYWDFWIDNKYLYLTSPCNTVVYLVVTAVTVLVFTLGYYAIEKRETDGPLIAKVNKLEQELLISSKECLLLKDELNSTKEKLNLFETSSNDKIITALQQELEESKKVRSTLENNVEVLQQELDAATEAGLDLNRMLSEILSQRGGSESLMRSVEHVQYQLNTQQKIIDEMTIKVINKTKENQELQAELTAANEKIDGLEGEIEDMKKNLNVHLKDNEDVISDLTSKNNELQLKIDQVHEAKEKEILRLNKMVSELEKKLKSTSDSLKIKGEECNNLKESVKKIKMKDNKNIDSLFDASRIRAELAQSTSENTSLKERLKVEEDKLGKLEDKVKKMDEEIHKLKLRSTEAHKEKLEAQTRLEVLSNYFKEKETQLQKELGLQEAMWVQKQGSDSTIYERMKSLEEETSSYKSQNEALKKEILDQERGLKAQISALEKKAHENWIAARQAERKLEESKQEAAQLRNKMTLMEKNMSDDLETSQHHRAGKELNGGDSLSPLLHDTSSPLLFPPPLPLDPNDTSLMPPGFIPPPMFMPPPPGGFMPPPPPFLPGDHRPPPLGRMSSPPLNNRFSPPPPEYSYDRISTPPMSPSNRTYRSPNESDRERFRHRTPTSPSFRSRNWQESPTGGMSGFRPITSERDTRREHKGGSNLSSGHSSDSLDKSSRHSGRV